MDSGLFQIFGADDIYFTMDMWARISSRPAKKKPADALITNIPFIEEVKQQIPAVPEKLTGAGNIL